MRTRRSDSRLPTINAEETLLAHRLRQRVHAPDTIILTVGYEEIAENVHCDAEGQR